MVGDSYSPALGVLFLEGVWVVTGPAMLPCHCAAPFPAQRCALLFSS